jgi:1,4-dihydroxy-2-naphthoyl-CoA hydrolase
MAEQGTAGAPDIGQPDIGQPDIGQPDIEQPDIGQPDTEQPDTERPDTGRPDTGRPDTGRPDTGQPDTGQPGQDQVLGELNIRMGIQIVDWNPQRMVATMPVAGNRQPYGLLHGGASCVLAETLGSTAAGRNAPPGRFPVGVEINASHHRSATSGTVTAVCTPVHVGGSLATFQVEITDERGRRVCTARLTCVYLERRPAGGSR